MFYRDKKQKPRIADGLEANTNMHREQHERLYAMATQPVELVRAENTAAEVRCFHGNVVDGSSMAAVVTLVY
jgi:hypothetical protein